MITVIVPVYNVSKYLDRCVCSVISQTYTDWRMVLVDDGSTDDSGLICDRYSGEHKNIITIHKENGGLSSARNTGLDWLFKQGDLGDYVFYIDSDDWIEENTFDLLISAQMKTNADIVCCGIKMTDGNGVEKNFTKSDFSEDYLEWTGKESIVDMTLNAHCCTVAWNKLYDVKLWKDIRYPNGRIHEDEFTTYKLLYCAKKVVFIKNLLYDYFQRADSIMGSLKINYSEDLLDALDERMIFLNNRKENELYSLTIVKFLNYVKYLYRGLDKNQRLLKRGLVKRYKNKLIFLLRIPHLSVKNKLVLLVWAIIHY